MSCQRKLRHQYGKLILQGNCYCYLCGQLITRYSDLSLDHVLPKKLGGMGCRKNLLPTHKICNCEKDCMTIQKFIKYKFDIDLIKEK